MQTNRCARELFGMYGSVLASIRVRGKLKFFLVEPLDQPELARRGFSPAAVGYGCNKGFCDP